MTNSILWNHDTAVAELGLTVPAWIEQTITAYDVAAITQGGCASGAYMPAVTYHTAKETMNEHGDDVLQYIEDTMGELPDVTGESWAGMACKYLSAAVELWASSIEDELADTLQDIEDNADEE